MIAPPNHGAELAAALRGNAAAKMLLGQALEQLGEAKAWEAFTWARRRASLRSSPAGWAKTGASIPRSPATTTASSPWPARLAGATDFARMSTVHTLLPSNATVRRYARPPSSNTATLVAADKRQPVEK